MTSWTSPRVPHYIDQDALALSTYEAFYSRSPHKTGNMRDHIDYQSTGSSIYFWDDCDYAGYQDHLVGKDGHLGAYYGWWTEDLPRTYDRVLSYLTDESLETPEWLTNLIEEATK